ncbi:M15 family metallopeptidase [Micromonosporaceae bacterium Da 78-11]
MGLSSLAFLAPAVVAVLVAGSATAGPRSSADDYWAEIRRIDAATAARMTGVSWRPGCPVPIADLRSVRLTFWGFDHRRHTGELVVHRQVATAVVDAFHRLYQARFPIRRMLPIEHYGGSDDASMAADNTSAFNCRPITGSTSGFSKHSYGKAIDLNTVENPYVKNGTVQPPAGRSYLNRAVLRPGMIVHGDRVWTAFARHGFQWGGDWTTLHDYQHFEVPLRSA